MATMMALVSVCASGQNARKYYKAGMEFVENLKYDDAIVQFTSAISFEPSEPDYYSARGQVYEKLLKYSEAKADYEKALVFSPKDGDILINIGMVCNKTGNFDEALKLLNRASVIDRRNPKLYPVKVITLIGLEKYDQALKVSDTALIIKDTPMDYYYRGIIYIKMNNDILGKKELEKSISKDKKLAEPRLALAELLIPTNTQEAMNQCNEVIANYDRNTDAYLMRSRVYKKNLDYPNAINDISKNILIDPSDPVFYLERGISYQEFNQHANAINDFSKYISFKADDPAAYSARAKSYEEIMNYDKAMEDYNKITVLSEFDTRARKMLKDAQSRLYELNREKVAPEITVVSPAPVNDAVEIRGDKSDILMTGKIKDKSKIKSFLINNEPVILAQKNGEYEFLLNINVNGLDKISLVARDDYDNEKVLYYTLIRTEIIPPRVSLVAPYTSDNGVVFLDSPTPNIAIQGRVTDESQIKSIRVGDITASYNDKELNPVFSATLNIANLNNFNIVAEDVYGNRDTTKFTLNREGSVIATNNPMGKTWVVIIENSGYQNFPALDGAIRDVSTIRRAFANYQISNIILKKDMTKKQMEDYFNIDLRNLVRENQVKSLLVWYAGHGKFLNDIGYWIPVNANRDDEYTYFNINGLKAGLQSYRGVVHTLVVSDACESGPGFYTAMRSATETPTCDDTFVAGAKSAQVFSSTGYTSAGFEKAVDNSKFTSTFASALMSNKNACIPIETIVKSVTEAVATESGQKPKFGKIQGLEDMNGTFFFIAK